MKLPDLSLMLSIFFEHVGWSLAWEEKINRDRALKMLKLGISLDLHNFSLYFAVAYSFSWCGDDARKRPKFDDITDSFAVGIWALVGPLGTALGSF